MQNFKIRCCMTVLFFFVGYQVQAQMVCSASLPDSTSGTLLYRGTNAKCGMQSQIFNDYFKHNFNFRPHLGQNITTTTQKEIKIRVVVVNNDNYSVLQYQEFNTSDHNELETIFNGWSNTGNSTTSGGLEKILFPTKPNTSNCITSCHIVNSKFKINMVDLVFINHNSTSYAAVFDDFGTYRDDSILNVFIVEHELYTDSITGVHLPAHAGINAWTSAGSNFGLSYSPHSQSYIFLAGTKNNAWGSYASFLHEIGHMFGLWHMYSYQPAQSECNVVGMSSNDWLSDIFPTGECIINNPWACDPLLDNAPLNANSCTGNFMGQGSRYLSPMQLGRMHRSAYLGTVSRYVYPTEAPNVTPWLITSTQDWDFGIRMYQDIIVKAGNTLTIKCEVQMPPGSKIIVEKGAKLVLDGGTITSYHPKATWAGIQLYGNKNAAPTAANQGSFEMKNDAMIEYAWDGVQDCIVPNYQGGGIIKASNSTFKDCWRAALLHDYPSWSRASTAVFDNMKFINANPSALTNQSMTSVGHLASFNERGIVVKNSTFENRLRFNDLYNSSYAIYGCDAGFTVHNNTFKGYKVGVYTTTYSNTPNRPNHVTNNSFDSLTTGINFSGNFSRAEHNNFIRLMGHVDQSNSTYKYGEAIYANNTGGLTIQKNEINAGGSIFEHVYGIILNDSKATGARIVDNEINNINIGIITQNNNPAADLLCNHFTKGIYNIAINPESPNSLFKNQGNGCHPTQHYRAGNTFDGGNTYVYTNLINSWDYYSWANDMTQIPVNQSGTFYDYRCTNATLGAQDPNSQCDLPGGIYERPGDFEEALSHWLSQSVLEQNSLMGLNTFDRLIRTVAETGTTADMIALLEEMNTNESKKLLLSLLLETKNYTRFDAVLNEIDPYEGPEHDNLVAYYNILKDLSVDNRPLWQLHEFEKNIVSNIAAADAEVSPYAKALLENAYGEVWYHHQEQMGMETMMGKVPGTTLAKVSQLFDAVPNPANHTTRIAVELLEADANNAQLVVRNLLGQVVYQQKLQEGKQNIDLHLAQLGSGIYTYSLNVNGKIVKTKRLVVNH